MYVANVAQTCISHICCCSGDRQRVYKKSSHWEKSGGVKICAERRQPINSIEDAAALTTAISAFATFGQGSRFYPTLPEDSFRLYWLGLEPCVNRVLWRTQVHSCVHGICQGQYDDSSRGSNIEKFRPVKNIRGFEVLCTLLPVVKCVQSPTPFWNGLCCT